jgi:hypothetical protein
MDFYKNRGGRIVTLDTNSKEIIEAIAAGEFTLIEDEKPVAKACVKKACAEKVIPPMDKEALTVLYKDKFGKRPFAGWDAKKLTEKLAE